MAGAGGFGPPVEGVDRGPAAVTLVELLGHGEDVGETPAVLERFDVGRLALLGPLGLRGFADGGGLVGAAIGETTVEGVLQALDASGARRSRAPLGLLGLVPEPSQVTLALDLGLRSPPSHEAGILVLSPHLLLPQRLAVEGAEAPEFAVHHGEGLAVHLVFAARELAASGLRLGVLERLLSRQNGAPGGLRLLVPFLGGAHGVTLGLFLVAEGAERDEIPSLADRARIALGLGQRGLLVEAGLTEPLHEEGPDSPFFVPLLGHPPAADLPDGVAIGVPALAAGPRRLRLGRRLGRGARGDVDHGFARRRRLLGRQHGADDEILVILLGQGARRHRHDVRPFRVHAQSPFGLEAVTKNQTGNRSDLGFPTSIGICQRNLEASWPVLIAQDWPVAFWSINF